MSKITPEMIFHFPTTNTNPFFADPCNQGKFEFFYIVLTHRSTDNSSRYTYIFIKYVYIPTLPEFQFV